MKNVIECRNLTHYYGNKLIYKNLSFEVPKGRILGLLGKNGTGKTTTINILNGYLKPLEGECLMFGENIRLMKAETRQRIALLIEGHIQYSFMNIEQIEKFYSNFYTKWNKDAYYQLMDKLDVAPKQKISRMSCGQRSQVALGLILAQNADLLILDDFSLGLDPGYRRLFIEYMRDFAKSENKTVFLTSHIIQDMEKLIDDCIILDYGNILIQTSINHLLANFKRFSFSGSMDEIKTINDKEFYNTDFVNNRLETFSFLTKEEVETRLRNKGIQCRELVCEDLNLEDAFIGLTGKY